MIGAVIAEYNPFHNGHLYQINEMRRLGCDCVIAVMSGDFTQRGEPAIAGKATRAKAAVMCGADLVLELPVVWAMSPAESFAMGGVSIIDALKSVDKLFFGSESGDIDSLLKIADISESADFKNQIKQFLASGQSYAAAYDSALEKLLSDGENKCCTQPGISDNKKHIQPNDILAVEYIRALKRLNSNIEPVAIKRKGVSHDEIGATGQFASASHLREMISDGKIEATAEFMPSDSFELIKKDIDSGYVHSKGMLDRAVLLTLRTMTAQEIGEIAGVSEGLENRIADAAKSVQSLDELYLAVKTKRYALSRIRRICMAALLSITKNDVIKTPPYIRILAQNERGAKLLSGIKAGLPIIGSYSQVNALDDFSKRIFDIQSRAAQVYSVACKSVIKNYSEQGYRIARIYK